MINMKLPFFSKKDPAKDTVYLALFLKETEGVAFVLFLNSGRMVIKDQLRITYSDGWENIVQDIDDVLFQFEKRLHISLDKTIFFMYSHFIDEKKHDIKKPYLQKIKEIVKNLELHALGYIECSEAVLSYFQKKEEMPLTAIVTELDKTEISMLIYKGGKTVFSKIVARTANLVDDFLTCFEEIKGKVIMPSRIILYNSKDLDDESTKILTYHWSEDYFIQIPRVEILKEDEVIDGLIKVFEEQIEKNMHEIVIYAPEKKEVMGFVLGEDIGNQQEIPDNSVREKTAVQKQNGIEKQPIQPVGNKPGHSVFKPIWGILAKFKTPSFHTIFKAGMIRNVLIVFCIVIIITALIMNEYVLHKATVTVFLPSQQVQKQITLIGQQEEGNGGDITVYVATSSASYSDSKQVTGKQDIGDKAKGTVTVYSFDDQSKTFAKGTTLTANNIQFTLDTDVTVASSSLTPDGSAKLPGKTDAPMTATDIGPAANLDKNQRFSIDNLPSSTYFAINSNALSGGSKKQVTTVSKQDITDLQNSVVTKAKNQLSTQLNQSSDEVILSPLSNVNLRDTKLSKEVGEEAQTLGIQATADYVYYYLRKSDLVQRIRDELQTSLQPGFAVDSQNLHYDFNSVKQSADGTIPMTIQISAKALKQVQKDKIIQMIKGKDKNSAATILKNDFGAVNFDLRITSPLPISNAFIPFFQKNIQVILSSL